MSDTVTISKKAPLRVAAWSAARLTRFLEVTTESMKILARACGHARLGDFALDDLTTHDRDLAHLTGVPYAGLGGV